MRGLKNRITDEDKQLLLNAINLPNTGYGRALMTFCAKYQVFDDDDILLLTDQKKCKAEFLSDYAMLRLIKDPSQIKQIVKDASGYNRYYPEGYTFGEQMYAFTSQLYGYGGKGTHKDNRTPFYNWLLGKIGILGKNDDEWWPSLGEYNPGISKDQWLTLLKDGTTFTKNAYFAIAAMYDIGGTATCRQLEEKYGKTSDFYRASLGVQLASKIKNKLDLPYCVGDKDKNQVWPILFQGRSASSDEPGNYVWRIRLELYDALKEFGIERYLKEGEEEVQELSIKDSMKLIKEYIASKGFSYDNELIENFYLSLKSKPFVILAGTSGTGKTRLVRLFAEAIGANYKLVSVRPDWSDSSDLFGHVNLKGAFVPGAIIDYIHEAAKPENINTPYFLCLDEMNLARVEYYLSDFLSIIETRHREDGHVVTDEIILDKVAADTYGKVVLPENLYVIGTVNMDETTFPFSKKVLDRANTIEFSYVDLVPDFSEFTDETEAHKCRNSFLKTDYITLMADVDAEDRQFVSDICIELQAINKILQGAQAHVGYRVRDEIVFYMLNNKKAELLDMDLAFDNEIMQKILPRIQGSSASIKDMLCELYKKCAGDYTGLSQASVSEQMQAYIETKDCKYRKSAEKICYMMRRFEEDGFTSYWL